MGTITLRGWRAAASMLLAAASPALVAGAPTTGVVQTVHRFPVQPLAPQGRLILADDGNWYGTAIDGGRHYLGSVFRMTSAGEVTTLASLPPTAASAPPVGGVVQGDDGHFYGVMPWGGANHKGVIYQVTASGTITQVADFDGSNGSSPTPNLVRGTDGHLYGTTALGGAADRGAFFRFTPGGGITLLHSFTDIEGIVPKGGLMVGAAGHFYGTTTLGGAFDGGTIFRLTAGGQFTLLASFTSRVYSQSALVQDAAGTLYGTTLNGGSEAKGSIFKLSSLGVLKTLVSFTGPYSNGLFDGLALADDGNLYGVTRWGGATGRGSVFRMTPNGVLTTLLSFAGADGANPHGALSRGADGQLYGSTEAGGPRGGGTLFRITTAGALTVLQTFDDTAGATPGAELVEDADGTLHGATVAGGANRVGTLFRFAGGAAETLLSFQNLYSGSGPGGLLRGVDGNLYGFTRTNGPFLGGTVFGFDVGASSHRQLHFFGPIGHGSSNGHYPASLMQAADGHLYGVTEGGGRFGVGTLFRAYTTGGINSLWEFHNDALGAPNPGLVEGPDGRLYGTANGEHLNSGRGGGGVFTVATDGAVAPLVEFDAATGRQPVGRLVRGRDGRFYGVNRLKPEGTTGCGSVFSVTTAGAVANEAVLPCRGITNLGLSLQDADGNLYGVGLDASTAGSVYRVSPAGQVATVIAFPELHLAPNARLLQARDGSWYGTSRGGEDSQGTIFRILPPPGEVKATASARRIELSWKSLPAATSYNVYRGTQTGAGQAQLVQEGITGGTASIPDLPNGRYFLRVTSVNDAGESWSSNEVSALVNAPQVFSFAPRSGVAPGTLQVSAPITVAGLIAPSRSQVTGDPTAQYSINGGAFSATPRNVVNGDIVRVRVKASASPATTTLGRLSVGGVGAAFRVTTAS